MRSGPARSKPRAAPHYATARRHSSKVLTPITDLSWRSTNSLPYAHWITPEGVPKRFDTWFFLAAAPPEQVGAHDGGGSADSIWVSPRERRWKGGESGQFKLPFPATLNLIRLNKQNNVKAALDDVLGKPDRDYHAGIDQTQRRPSASHPAGGRLRRRGPEVGAV